MRFTSAPTKDHPQGIRFLMSDTLTATEVVHYEIKKSKFIAILEPYSDPQNFANRRQQLLSEYPKASHICYAWRSLEDQQTKEGFSDDGEPSGTAGIPLLRLLQQQGMINTQVLVVRYFGGIKLGTGGLMRGYTEAAKLGLNQAGDNASRVTFHPQSVMNIQADFASEQYLRLLCDRESITITGVHYSNSGFTASLSAPLCHLKALRKIIDLRQDITLISDGNGR